MLLEVAEPIQDTRWGLPIQRSHAANRTPKENDNHDTEVGDPSGVEPRGQDEMARSPLAAVTILEMHQDLDWLMGSF